MRILLIEPFMGESHKAWAEGYALHSQHDVQVMGLPGRHWKWRMHGAAETFARMYHEAQLAPDLILATDMLDVAGFLALTRDRTATTPIAVYFHENQLAYPWSPSDPDPQLQRDHHYGYINYRSALVADRVLWNSAYNQTSFLAGLDKLLRAFPDHQELGNVDLIRQKSTVLPLGMAFHPTDARRSASTEPPLIIWNHRWEYDKGPDLFFETLMTLADEGIAFRLAVLGRSYNKTPSIFAEARERLQDRIVHWGFVESGVHYHALLAQGDLLPVTSQQDFFGASIVEAMHHGCMPLLPDALAYPAHIPLAFQPALLYQSAAEFTSKLRAMLLGQLPIGAEPHKWVAEYAWEVQAPRYDRLFETMVGK
jgi:glycosyltransferase involved in cell wall biosynthesis